jgi:ribose transport system substrate-binding protein
MASKKFVRHLITAGVVVALGAALGACGSSGSSPSPSGSTALAAATASSTATTGASSDVAAAQKTVAQAEQQPTRIAQTQALPTAPPKGKTFVWLQCDIPSCTNIGDGISAAMKAAGWKYQAINYQAANPATLTAAFKQALTLHPTVVAESGVPPQAGWSSVLPAYKAAGVPIITDALGPTRLTATIIADVDGPSTFENFARIQAALFTVDSNGTGKGLVERVDSFPILKSYSDALVKYIKADCPSCQLTSLQNSAADASANAIVPSIVSALKRNPSLNYVLPCDSEFLDALPSALTAAQLSAKILGESGDLADLGYVKSGKFGPETSDPQEEAGWTIADAAFNYAEGRPVPAADNGPLPTWLLTPSETFPTTKLLDYPTNFAGQFEKLWHLS